MPSRPAQGYGSWLHGEAIAVGMFMAADLSHRLDWIGTGTWSASGPDLVRPLAGLAALKILARTVHGS